MEITKELLEANGWIPKLYEISCELQIPAGYLYIGIGNVYAEWQLDRKSLKIWIDYNGEDVYSDIYVRVCDTTEKLAMAFKLADIDYNLKTE